MMAKEMQQGPHPKVEAYNASLHVAARLCKLLRSQMLIAEEQWSVKI
jgi:hypothetical protein